MRFFRFSPVFFLCLAGLVPLAPAGAASPEQSLPKDISMQETDSPRLGDPSSGLTLTYLPNGLAVAVKKDSRFPLASLRLYVHAGSAYETPDMAGISHQLEHMVFKGTESRPKGAIATDIEKAGGYLNAATSFDYTVYLTDMPSGQWKLGMDVLKDMAFHPRLEPEELESEKEVVLAELRRGEDTPSGRLFKRIQASTLKGTPYERPIIGFPETIRAYSVEGMRAYIDRLYQPQSMLLLVVGDVDPDEVLAEAGRLFGSIPNTAAVVPPSAVTPEDFPADGPSVAVETTPWNKVHLSVAFPGVSDHDARAAALDVFSHLLGGDTSAYLYKTYKYDKRLVDTISVSSYTFERAGLFTINATLDAAKLEAFWTALTKDLPTLAERAFTAQELDRARLAVTDGLYRQKETVAGAASALGYFLFFDNGKNGEQTYLQKIDLVDHAAIAKAAESVLKPERLSSTVLIPSGTAGETATAKITAEASRKQLTDTLLAAWPVSRGTVPPSGTADAGPAREVIELGKGRTLILQPDTSMPYAAVELAFTGGDSLSPSDRQGLAALTAAVLTRGTKAMNAVALEAFKNDRASSLDAASGRETFRLFMDYPARFAPDMWKLLHETLTTATLPKTEVERSRENQIAAIVSREDQPLALAFRRVFPFLFGTHLYGYQSQGSKERVAAFTQKDIAAFWQKQVRQPWALSVCGVFDRDAVVAAAKKLPVPQDTAVKISPPAWTGEKELNISLPERNQAHLLLVFPSAPVGSEDEPGMALLQNILSGQSGLLFRDLRDKQGLGYTVTAIDWQAPLAGMLMFYIGTDPDKVGVAGDGFAKVIKELQETPLPEEELVRGKNQMRGEYLRARQRMSARSSEAANLAITGRSLDAEQELVDAAFKLTPEGVRDLARKYLVMDAAYVVKVLPE